MNKNIIVPSVLLAFSSAVLGISSCQNQSQQNSKSVQEIIQDKQNYLTNFESKILSKVDEAKKDSYVLSLCPGFKFKSLDREIKVDPSNSNSFEKVTGRTLTLSTNREPIENCDSYLYKFFAESFANKNPIQASSMSIEDQNIQYTYYFDYKNND